MTPTWPEETVPILHVSDAAASIAWYSRLGFVEEWTHRFEPDFPAFVSVRRGSPGDGVRLFLSEHRGDGTAGASVYLRVNDVEAIASAFDAKVDDVGSRVEVRLTDPDGNRITAGALTGQRGEGYTYPDAPG